MSSSNQSCGNNFDWQLLQKSNNSSSSDINIETDFKWNLIFFVIGLSFIDSSTQSINHNYFQFILWFQKNS